MHSARNGWPNSFEMFAPARSFPLAPKRRHVGHESKLNARGRAVKALNYPRSRGRRFTSLSPMAGQNAYGRVEYHACSSVLRRLVRSSKPVTRTLPQHTRPVSPLTASTSPLRDWIPPQTTPAEEADKRRWPTKYSQQRPLPSPSVRHTFRQPNIFKHRRHFLQVGAALSNGILPGSPH